jgi:hypothetical protein
MVESYRGAASGSGDVTPAALDILERMAHRAENSPNAKSTLLIAAELRKAWREMEIQRRRGNLLKAVAELYKEELDQLTGRSCSFERPVLYLRAGRNRC